MTYSVSTCLHRGTSRSNPGGFPVSTGNTGMCKCKVYKGTIDNEGIFYYIILCGMDIQLASGYLQCGHAGTTASIGACRI